MERLGSGGSVWEFGTIGVDIFFVISGFVMVISSRNLVGTDDGWKKFIIKRSVRIIPMYWLALTLKLIILILTTGLVLHANLDWWYILKSYFFIPSENINGEIKPFLGVGWTLIFEMFFYVIFMMALFFRKNIYIFVGYGLILLVFASLSTIREPDHSSAWYFMDTVVLEFYFGMIFGYLTLKEKRLPTSLSIFAFATSLIYVLTSTNTLQLPMIIENGVPAAVIVWSIISLEVHLQKRIPTTVMFFGSASYALYLFHPLISPLAPELLKRVSVGSTSASVILSLAIAMSIAGIVYRYIEIPLTNVISNAAIKKTK